MVWVPECCATCNASEQISRPIATSEASYMSSTSLAESFVSKPFSTAPRSPFLRSSASWITTARSLSRFWPAFQADSSVPSAVSASTSPRRYQSRASWV